MKQNWDIRWFALADLPDLVKLHQEAFPHERWIAQRFCDFTDICGNGCLVATKNERVVASVLYRSVGKHTRIEYISVVPAWRERGIGRRLLKTLTRGRRRGLFTAFARENETAAHLFFSRCGFTAVPPFICENYFSDGTAAIPFQLRVRQKSLLSARLTVGA